MSPHPVQSGKQPDNPQQTPQQSRPQALLHLHDCPIAAAARNTCAHTDNNNKSDCAICQVTAHEEAARREWLELVCICELHNPHPRLNTLAGRHKLDQAVRTTGAKELVTLSWARGTINALAQILDDNFERVLQARISGRDSITEDDVRVINGAADLMGRILPWMLGTQGDFWIDDEEILIHVPADRVEAGRVAADRVAADLSPQELRQSQVKGFHQIREARRAREDFESFRYRVSKDLEFIGSEQEGDQSPFYKENPDIWAVDQGIIHEKYLQQKHSEAERAALTSMLKQQLLRPQGAQEQQQQADPLVVNGSTPYSTTATPPAPVTTTYERQQGLSPQPKVTAITPQPDTTAQQQPNVKAVRVPLREEQRRYRPRQSSKGSISYIVHDQPPKPAASRTTAPKTDTHIPQETQPRNHASGFHQPAYPGSDLLMCEPKSQRQQQPQQQSKPANPHVVKDSCLRFAALEATEPKTNIRVPHETQPKAHAAGWHQPAYPGEDLLMCEPPAHRQRQPAGQAQQQPAASHAASSPPPKPTASQPAAPETDTPGQQQQKAQLGASMQVPPWRGPPPPFYSPVGAPSAYSSGDGCPYPPGSPYAYRSAYAHVNPLVPGGPYPPGSPYYEPPKVQRGVQQQAQPVHSQHVDSFRAPKPPSTTAKPTPQVPAKTEQPEAQLPVNMPLCRGGWAMWPPPEQTCELWFAMDPSVDKELRDARWLAQLKLQGVDQWFIFLRDVLNLGIAKGLDPLRQPLPRSGPEAALRSDCLAKQLLATELAPHEHKMVIDYMMGPRPYIAKEVARAQRGDNAAAKLPTAAEPTPSVPAKCEQQKKAQPTVNKPPPSHGPWAVCPPEDIGLLHYEMDRSVVKQLSDQEWQVRAQLQAVNDWGWLRRRVIDLGTARGLNPREEPLPKTAEEATRRSQRLVHQLLGTPLAPHEQNLVADYSMGPGEYVSRSVARILAGPAAAKLPELTTPRSYVRAKIASGDLPDPDSDHPLAPQWPWSEVFNLEDGGPTGRGNRTTPPLPPARQSFGFGGHGIWAPKPGPSDDQNGQENDLRAGLFTRPPEAQPSSSTTAGATPDTPSVTVPSTIKKNDEGNMPEIVVGSRVAPNNSSETNDVTMTGVGDTHQPQNKDQGKEKEKAAVVPAKRSMPPGMARRKVRQSMASNKPIIRAYDATMKGGHDSHQPGGKGKGKDEENSKEQNPPVLLEKRIGGHNYTFLRSPSAVTRMEDEQKEEAAVVGAASPSTSSSLPDLIEACDVVMEDADGANQPENKCKGKEKEQDLPELTDSAILRRYAGDLPELSESELLRSAREYFQKRPSPSPAEEPTDYSMPYSAVTGAPSLAEEPRPKVSQLQGREPLTRHDLDKDYIASIKPLFYDFDRATTTGRASKKIAPPPPESPQEIEWSQFDFKDLLVPASDADYLASATPTSEYDITQWDSVFPPPPAEPPRPASQDKKISHRGVRGGRPRRSENEQQQQVKTTPQPTNPPNEKHNPPHDDYDYLDSITPSSSYEFGRAAPTSGNNNNVNAAPSPVDEETQQQQRQDNALHPSDPSATPPSTVSWDDVMEMDFNAVFPSVADLRGLSSPDARSEDSWTDAVMEQDGESSGSSDDF